MDISKELKAKNEELISAISMNGKFTVHFHTDEYIREVCTDFDASFEKEAYVSRYDWEHFLKACLEGVQNITIQDKKLILNNCKAFDVLRVVEPLGFKRKQNLGQAVLSPTDIKKLKKCARFSNLKSKNLLPRNFYFTETGRVITSEGYILSNVAFNSDFCKLVTSIYPKKDEFDKGILYILPFKFFDGKKNVNACIVEDSKNKPYVKLTDGEKTIYTQADFPYGYGNYKKLTDKESLKNHLSGKVINLSKFDNKHLLKTLESFDGKVSIKDGSAYTDGVKITDVGTLLNGFTFKADYLGNVSALLGDKLPCLAGDKSKVVVFGDLEKDYALVMPCL